MTPNQPARLIVVAVLAALPIAAADHFPETAKDSEPILDEQYHQMDRYFDQQIAKAAQIRAQYWNRLDFSSGPNFDRSADAYRRDWAKFLDVPDPAGAPLNVKRVKVRELVCKRMASCWFRKSPPAPSPL